MKGYYVETIGNFTDAAVKRLIKTDIGNKDLKFQKHRFISGADSNTRDLVFLD